MLAACIDRMAADGCDSCARRDACASLFAGLFRSVAPDGGSSGLLGNLFRGLARETGRAMEARRVPRDSVFRRRVAAEIERQLDDGPVRIDQVARALGTSRQTLYRRLKEEGVTFEEVLDGLRRRLAVRLLRQGHPVKAVAYRLGFSDPAAFSRAFKRWTGSSPNAARR